MGESLGGAVVTRLAPDHPPAGLLLRSPFTELAAVAQRHFPFLPVRWLLRDRFPVADLTVGIDVPTTVVYGTADTLVPPELSLSGGRRDRPARWRWCRGGRPQRPRADPTAPI